MGVADGPFARACSLGILQALYAVIGGMVTGSADRALPFLGLFLFFAMTASPELHSLNLPEGGDHVKKIALAVALAFAATGTLATLMVDGA